MGWAAAAVGMAQGAYGYLNARKGRKDVQKLQVPAAAPMAKESDDSAEEARRDAQRAAARKKGLQSTILAGETGGSGGGPLKAGGKSGGF